MLEIKNLKVNVDTNEILKGVNLSVKGGQTHIVMGKNGSGKSSLLNTIVKNPKYNVVGGSIAIDNVDLCDKSVSEVAQMGVFLSFQNPPAISGLVISTLLKYSVNSVRKARGEKPLSAPEFFKKVAEYCEILQIPQSWLKREMNVGFSGGEKKRISCLEMMFLEPKVALLDEPDSGVDVDSVNIIIKAIDYMKSKGTAFVVVSHYPQLISNIAPDFVHIMKDGVIVKSGDSNLADTILKEGFENV